MSRPETGFRITCETGHSRIVRIAPDGKGQVVLQEPVRQCGRCKGRWRFAQAFATARTVDSKGRTLPGPGFSFDLSAFSFQLGKAVLVSKKKQ